MPTIQCTDCGGTVSLAAAACPHCGAPQERGRAKAVSPWGTPTQAKILVVLLVVLAIVAAYAIYWQFIYEPSF